VQYYGNPSSETIRDHMSAGTIGCIITPHQRNIVFSDEWDTIADNGCFSKRWSSRHWFDWLIQTPRSVRFAVCPDVFDPAGAPCHDQTLELWQNYSPKMRRAGFTPAFVCQVGATAETVPADADVLFLGGTTEWKLGPEARRITAARGERWVHMGRVNSSKRLEIARSMGCDSADGTFLTYGPDKNIVRLLKWLNDDDRQTPPPLQRKTRTP